MKSVYRNGVQFGAKAVFGLALIAAASGLLDAGELQSATLKAWQAYIRGVDQRMQEGRDGKQRYLWADESPDRIRRIQHGEVVVAPMTESGSWSVPDGLIHHWIGAIFIPGATMQDALAITHNYDRYKDYFKPVVADSKLLACTPGGQEFSMVWRRQVLFVNATIQTRYDAYDVFVDDRRAYNIAETTRVQQIKEYGQTSEHLMAPDTGDGYIWRLHTIVRYEQRDGGVYLEIEAIALTRDIPTSLRWLLKPVINHLSFNSLTATLRQTRDAVRSLPSGTKRVALCTTPNRGAEAVMQLKEVWGPKCKLRSSCP